MRWLALALFGCFAMGVVLFLARTGSLVVEYVELSFPNLPQGFEGFRLLLLSDFHSKGCKGLELEVLETVRQLKPEVVLIAGDIVDSDTTRGEIEACRGFWEELAKASRVYAVLGNHDYANHHLHELIRTLEEVGIELISDEAIELERNGSRMWLIGLETRAGLQALRREGFRLVATHFPGLVKKLRRGGYEAELALAGHTHGGQLRIGGFDLGQLLFGFKAGLQEVEGTKLYVTRGVGTWFVPVRINCPPEVTLITLHRER